MSVPLLPSKAQRIAALKALLSGMDGAVSIALADIGDLLRRSDALGIDGRMLQGRLSKLRAEDIRREVDGEDGRQLKTALASAIEESLESFFSDDPAEQEEWRTSAAQALLLRDRMQSVARAIELLAMTQDALVATAEALEKKLKALDEAVAPHARALVPLNEFRRNERDLLNATERGAAWWFTSRADCDPFLKALAGETDNPHTPECPECIADLKRTEVVLKPPAHLTAELAFDLSLGVLPESVEQRYRQHAETCSSCADMLKASDAGERAIEELESSSPPELPKMAARRSEEKVLEENKDFRVLLRRRESSWRLVVAPRSGVTIASASLTVSSKRNALAPHAISEGLEFDLGESVDGVKAQLRLKLGNAPAPIERGFSL